MSQDSELEALLQRGYRFALALTHDPDRASDLLQDAWVAILRRGAPRHVGYLFKTLRNRFIDQERRRRLVALEPLDSIEHDADALSFLDEASWFPDLDTVGQALGELRPVEREALFLAAVEGHSVREIAELTEQPLGTVSSLVQRARRKVRQFFDHSFDRGPDRRCEGGSDGQTGRGSR